MEASLTGLLGGDPDKNASAIIATVRDLAASDPSSLSFILTKFGGGDRPQRSSIGTGLGQAATICQRTDLPFATDIQTQLLAEDHSIDSHAAETASRCRPASSRSAPRRRGARRRRRLLGRRQRRTDSSLQLSDGLRIRRFQSLGTYSTKSTVGLFTIGGNGSTSYPQSDRPEASATLSRGAYDN